MTIKRIVRRAALLLLPMLLILTVGCGASLGSPTAVPAADTTAQVEEPAEDHAEDHNEDHAEDHNETAEEHEHGAEEHTEEDGMLAMPPLEALSLDGRPLQVVATTGIIGDVVSRVGGDAITLTTLMAPGQDPHSYEPSAAQLTAVSGTDVLLVNGWDLEESLLDILANVAGQTPLVPVSAGIEPLPFDGEVHHDEHDEDAEHEEEAEAEHEHDHGAADPHVWLDVNQVLQWVTTIETALSTLDPAQATTYAANAAAYRAELEDLQVELMAELATIPPERRFLVTNHESLNYFANAYGFETIGTVIPSASTLAEPSARDLASLIRAMEEQNVCTIFAETTVSDVLAQTVAGELNNCDTVQVLPLYTGSLGLPGSDADSYTGMMRANVQTIVQGLR